MSLLDAIDDHGYEAEDITFAEELTTEAPFVPHSEDEGKLKQYRLHPVPSALQEQAKSYVKHRCATFSAKRSGAAVVSATAEHDIESLLKFFGWMGRYGKVPQGAFFELSLLARRDVGELAEQFCEWLVANQKVRYTTSARGRGLDRPPRACLAASAACSRCSHHGLMRARSLQLHERAGEPVALCV